MSTLAGRPAPGPTLSVAARGWSSETPGRLHGFKELRPYADIRDLMCDPMSLSPAIPDAEHEVLPNPPLKVMLGQLRFPTVLRIGDLGSLIPFQEAMRQQFPTLREEQQLSFVFGPQGPQETSAQRAWRFVTGDGAWSFLLTQDAVTLEADVTRGYTSYDQFVERFRLVWTAILERFAPSKILRQGLRYVDHVEATSAVSEWASIINADLLGPLVERFGAALSQTVSELRLTLDDGVLVFKHGILPLGPNAKVGYLLDFDCFNEDSSDDTSLEAVIERFDRYHATVYSLFRWCVTDAALEAFRGQR